MSSIHGCGKSEHALRKQPSFCPAWKTIDEIGKESRAFTVLPFPLHSIHVMCSCVSIPSLFASLLFVLDHSYQGKHWRGFRHFNCDFSQCGMGRHLRMRLSYGVRGRSLSSLLPAIPFAFV